MNGPDEAEVVVIGDGGAPPAALTDLVARHHVAATADLASVDPARFPGCHLYIIDVSISRRDTLRRLRHLMENPTFERIARVFILDTHKRSEVVRIFDLGATDYLVRPISDVAFIGTMAKLVTESVERSWEALNEIQKSALKMSLKSFDSCFDAARTGRPLPIDDIKESCRLVVDAIGFDGVDACMKAVRGHHNYTFRHSMFVSGYLVSFGYAAGIRGDDLKKLALGGMLHDIGKSHVPLTVLDSPNRLDDEEWVVMRRHPEHSETILERMKRHLDQDIVEMAVRHHEKLDGTGYPYGLAATELSDLVRMTSIVDVYSGLIDKRSYKTAMAGEQAFDILNSMDGHLDLELVRGFQRLMLD